MNAWTVLGIVGFVLAAALALTIVGFVPGLGLAVLAVLALRRGRQKAGRPATHRLWE